RAAVGAGWRAVGRAVAVAVIAAAVAGAGAARAHAHREGEGGRAEDVAASNGHVVLLCFRGWRDRWNGRGGIATRPRSCTRVHEHGATMAAAQAPPLIRDSPACRRREIRAM